MVWLDRSRYAAIYGPTVGDEVRLGDTDLWIQIERDLTVGGEEAVFGGGKSIRESMAQATTTRADGALDTVITNAIILDWWGIIRADIGIRDGRIVGIGHAGNPDISDGIDMVIGPSTDVISGEGRIVTAGAIDSLRRLLSPSQIHEALATGIRRSSAAEPGPEGSKATTVTPGRGICQPCTARSIPCRSTYCCSARATWCRWPRWRSRRSRSSGDKVHEDWAERPPRYRRVPACGRGGACRWRCTSLAERSRLRRVNVAAIAADRSMPSTSKERAAGTRPISSRWRVTSTSSRSTDLTLPHTVNTVAQHSRHAHGLLMTQPRGAEDPRSRSPASARPHDRGGRHPARHRRPVGHVLDAEAHGPHGEGHYPDLAGTHVMKHRRGASAGDAGRQCAREALRREGTRSTPAIAHGILVRRRVDRGRPARRPRRSGMLRSPPRSRGQRRHDPWASLGDLNASIPTRAALQRAAFGDAIGADLSVSY